VRRDILFQRGIDLLIKSDGGRAWRNAQLLPQQVAQSGKLLQSGLGAAQQMVEAHQLPVGRFAERVGGGQSLGIGERLLVVVLLLVQRDQPLQHPQVQLPQPLPLKQRPVVVALFQKVGPVQGHRFAQFK
jgi:hypothetical protein